MTGATDLSFLSWNPRITEHCENYDNPWDKMRRICGSGKKFGPPTPIIITDIKTSTEHEEPSLCATARLLEVNTGTIADKLKNGRAIRDRYTVRKATAC